MNRKFITALDDGLKNKVNWHDIALTFFFNVSSIVDAVILARILHIEFAASDFIPVAVIFVIVFSLIEIVQSAMGRSW